MSETADMPEKSLLPEGLYDHLPPEAERRWTVTGALLATFAANGFDQVAPPLAEFEESLAAGAGEANNRHMFRVMDPASQRMMAVRADMTVQIARIAASRLAAAPRPLRLCYAGPVLRVKGLQFRPERQLMQAGFEIIGDDTAVADIEAVVLAAEAVAGVGIDGLSVDLSLPPLLPAIGRALAVEAPAFAAARAALDAKDGAAISAFDGELGDCLARLADSTGPAETMIEALAGLHLPGEGTTLIAAFIDHIRAIREAAPDLPLTVDLGDSRGFHYYSGPAFALFAPGGRGELGRGGRYLVDFDGAAGEPACGFSVYVDSLLRCLPAAQRPPLVLLSGAVGRADIRRLHSDGWRTVLAGGAVDDVAAEARRLGCSHLYENGRVTPVGDKKDIAE